MPKILVVEDEPNVRKLVTVNLVQRGYQVLEAGDGQTAWEYLSNQNPALLILDIKLPDMTGWDILDQFGDRNFPVLVMTATPVDQSSILTQYPCVAEILVKPFNINKLLSAILRVLPPN
jgi:DNA-binding response OmpR family regulator